MLPLPIFATYIKAPIENFLQDSRSQLALDIYYQCLAPINDQFDQIPQYQADFEIRDTLGDRLSRKSTGKPIIAIDYQGTLDRQILGGSTSHRHQLRLVVAVPNTGTGSFSRCENLRDWAIAVINYGLSGFPEVKPLIFPGYGLTGAIEIYSIGRVQLIDDETCFVCNVTFVLPLRRLIDCGNVCR